MTRLKQLSLLCVVAPLLGVTVPRQAAGQVGVDTPDFYSRPSVSPYVDLLRRNDGQDFLRYNRNVVRDLRILDDQRRTVREERQLRDDFRRDIDTRSDRLQEELDRATGGTQAPRGDTRLTNPFYQPRSNRLTGASLNIRPTGHSVTHLDFSRFNNQLRFGGGAAGTLRQQAPLRRPENSASLNRARSYSQRNY